MIKDFYSLKPSQIRKLPFDTIIQGEFLGGTYTHLSDNESMFLMQERIDSVWKTLNWYCVGVHSFVVTVNQFDSKKMREQYKKLCDG